MKEATTHTHTAKYPEFRRTGGLSVLTRVAPLGIRKGFKSMWCSSSNMKDEDFQLRQDTL